MNKKRWLIGIGILIIILVASNMIMYATGIYKENNDTEEKNNSEKVNSQPLEFIDILEENILDNNLITILKSKGQEPDEISLAIEEYTKIISLYNPSEVEMKYIIDLVKEDYDLRKVLSIYDFLTDTDYDITMVKEMYDVGNTVDFEGKYWRESAFNAATKKKHGVLTSGEINDYSDKGISYEDISVASIVSRKGIKTINEILDQKVEGTSWTDIFNQIYKTLDLDKQKFAKAEGSTILNCVKAAKVIKCNVNEIFDKTNGDIQGEVAKYISPKRNEIKTFLLDNNLDFKNNKQAMDDVKQKLSKNGLTEDEIGRYMMEGFTSREIRKAINISESTGIYIKDVLNRYKNYNIWTEDTKEVNNE